MKQRMMRWTAVLLGAVLLACVCLPAVASGLFSGLRILSGEETVTIPRSEYERLQRFSRLDEILQLAERYYIDEPDLEEMLAFAADTILYSLDDPYSMYITQDGLDQLAEEREGIYTGVGLQLTVPLEDQRITVTRVFKNSPAEAAGVERGDKIIAVNGVYYAGAEMSEAVAQMRGTPDTEVTVTFVRGEDEEPFDLVLLRQYIEIENVTYKVLEDDIGYLLLYEFTGTDVQRFFEAINLLLAQGVRGVIVDLRDNPGGYVPDAVQIADKLVPEGLVVYTEDRYGNRDNYKSDGDMLGMPLVLLVNEYSASASEILTGAVKDYGVGKIVGTKTFGKGIVQTQFVLPAGDAAVRLTTMRYYTPAGICIHGEGIEPDVLVEQPEEVRKLGTDVPYEQDVQLLKAVEVLRESIAEHEAQAVRAAHVLTAVPVEPEDAGE